METTTKDVVVITDKWEDPDYYQEVTGKLTIEFTEKGCSISFNRSQIRGLKAEYDQCVTLSKQFMEALVQAYLNKKAKGEIK
jgi:hypothetical protein